jgi:hypothetical protein
VARAARDHALEREDVAHHSGHESRAIVTSVQIASDPDGTAETRPRRKKAGVVLRGTNKLFVMK